MIQKIERLISIGKFRDYSARGNVAFNKMTLIYADNGSGKTTLSAVLRSLTTNNHEIIRNRISTNAVLPQSAQIIQRLTAGDTHFTFRATGWSGVLQDIEIFDIHFVNENIYSGFDFKDDQRRQLHQFVIGAAGVGVRQQIEQNKVDKAACRQRQEGIEQTIIRTVGNGLNNDLFSKFIAITANQNTNIDQKITLAEATLQSAQSNAVLQTLPRLAFLRPLNYLIAIDELIKDLEMSSVSILNDILTETFTNHCADLSANRVASPENWLRMGFKYFESKAENNADQPFACPFCQQAVDDSANIIQAYILKFNEEFNSLIGRLGVHSTNLDQYNLNTALQTLNDTGRLNSERITSWRTHLPNSTPLPVFNIIVNEELFINNFRAVRDLLSQKQQNPSISLNTNNISVFHGLVDEINENIARYNEAVVTYNGVVDTFLRGIQTVADAQNQLNGLRRIKSRFEPAIISLIANLAIEKTTLRGLETAYTALMAQQQLAASAFFIRYKDRINHYLTTVFKTPFLIDRVAHVAPQGRATASKIDYKLTIHGVDISFNGDDANCAKDCLSEGDKSTIALAFFLSKLDIDGAIGNKIVVFDDPLSSFDRNRRQYTVQLLKDLLSNVKQLIVLSHNETFLHQVSKTTTAAQKTCLRISENFNTQSAFIEQLSLDALVENDYFKHITELETFLNNPDINKKDSVLGHMRNVLEAHISFKFYRQLSNIPPNNRTFGVLISALNNPPQVIFRDNTNRSDIINKLNIINGVSCKPHHGEAVPDYATLGIDPALITTTELANLVQDTLNLIDNLL